jgi:hypothetical protein
LGGDALSFCAYPLCPKSMIFRYDQCSITCGHQTRRHTLVEDRSVCERLSLGTGDAIDGRGQGIDRGGVADCSL